MSEQDWTSASSPGATPKITSIFDFSAEALGQLKVWLEQSGLNLPISQVVGFQQFTAEAATRINTSENTTSGTYADLATVGPSITGLADGKYVLFFGAAVASAGAGSVPFMGISVNGDTPSDVEATQGSDTTFGTAGSTAIIRTLSNGGNNTLTAKYKSSDGATSCAFNRRWLIALRYANP